MPGEVLNLRFLGNDFTIGWDPVSGAARCNVYRGDGAVLSYANTAPAGTTSIRKRPTPR